MPEWIQQHPAVWRWKTQDVHVRSRCGTSGKWRWVWESHKKQWSDLWVYKKNTTFELNDDPWIKWITARFLRLRRYDVLGIFFIISLFPVDGDSDSPVTWTATEQPTKVERNVVRSNHWPTWLPGINKTWKEESSLEIKTPSSITKNIKTIQIDPFTQPGIQSHPAWLIKSFWTSEGPDFRIWRDAMSYVHAYRRRFLSSAWKKKV